MCSVFIQHSTGPPPWTRVQRSTLTVPIVCAGGEGPSRPASAAGSDETGARKEAAAAGAGADADGAAGAPVGPPKERDFDPLEQLHEESEVTLPGSSAAL
jgi:hypothetical protein